MAYAEICDHARLKRINDNFVRCLKCGKSMISQQNVMRNKTGQDFARENKSFTRNFNRNFSNEIEEVDEEFNEPILEYYTDPLRINNIFIDRRPVFHSDPPKYKTIINGETKYLIDTEIQKILRSIGATKQYNNAVPKYL